MQANDCEQSKTEIKNKIKKLMSRHVKTNYSSLFTSAAINLDK